MDTAASFHLRPYQASPTKPRRRNTTWETYVVTPHGSSIAYDHEKREPAYGQRNNMQPFRLAHDPNKS